MIHEVVWLASSTGGIERRFPYLESTAEGDQECDWRWPLTSLKRPEIVYVEIRHTEVEQFEWMMPDQPGLLQFQSRINQRLRRDDLRVTWKFITAKNWAKAPNAETVFDFPEVPKREYMDIFAPGRFAREIGRESVEVFVESGGLFTIV